MKEHRLMLGLRVLSIGALLMVACPPAFAFNLGRVIDTAKAADAKAKNDEKDSAKVDQKADAKDSCDVTAKLSPWTGPKKRLGIMDMEVKITTTSAMQPTNTGGMTSTTSVNIPPPADFGTGLTEMMTTALIDTGRFILLERKALMDIQSEQALAASGSVDPASAAGSGKLLGAQALIRGAVTEFSYSSSSTGGSASMLKGVSLAATSSEALVGLDIRIYDVATGQILDSVKAMGKAKSSGTAVNVDKPDWKVGGTSFKQSPLGEATRNAITKAVIAICGRMDLIPWEGKIADIEEGTPPTLYLNSGTQVGMKEGMTLEIVRPGRAITDPETRTVIGRTKDTYLGKCKITQCMEKLSLAEPIEGQDFKVGDAIHLLDWKGPVNRDAPPPPAQPAVEPTQSAQPPAEQTQPIQPTEQTQPAAQPAP